MVKSNALKKINSIAMLIQPKLMKNHQISIPCSSRVAKN
jgi:hypothetical protein